MPGRSDKLTGAEEYGPGDAGWDINTVKNSPTKMKQIVSVRVALVVRGEYYDTTRDAAGTPPHRA